MKYKQVEEFNDYIIFEDGSLYSLKTDKFLKPCKILGYSYYTLCNNGLRKSRRTHRLLAKAFIPNPENKPEINHKDGNKLNNSLDNLGWCTRKENAKHAQKNGLYRSGEDHGRALLTRAKVDEIKEKHEQSTISTYSLAEEYGVSQSTIMRILDGTNWTT